MRSLAKPRRVLTAVVLFVVLGGAGSALLGLARAGSEEVAVSDPTASDAPTGTSLRLPAPQVGDHGIYRFSIASGGRTQGQSYDVEFAWLADEQVPAPDGGRIWANHLYLNDTRGGRVDDLFLPAGATQPAMVRYGAAGTEATTTHIGWLGTGPATASHNSTAMEYIPAPYTMVPCGLRNVFQEHPVAFGASVPDPYRCKALPNADLTRDVQFRNGRAEGDLVRFEWWMDLGYHNEDGNPMYPDGPTWQGDFDFRADVPYPVAIRFEHFRWDLVAFTAGSSPLRSFAAAEPVPPMRFAPLDQDGPDETGITHPISLATAFAAANTGVDPDLTSYLAQHPAAKMVYARHVTDSYRGHGLVPQLDVTDQGDRWWFGVSDGSSMYETGIDHSTVTQYGTQQQPTTTKIDPSPCSSEQSPLPLDKLPQSLPTVASMMAPFSKWEGRPANDWGFCLVESGGRPSLTVWAGYSNWTNTADFPGLSTTESSFQEYQFSWNPDGTLDRWYRTEQTTSPNPGAPPRSMTPQPPASTPRPLVFAGFAALTPADATTVGFGALLSALAYFFGPALKGGVVGLFSKTQDNALLRNPIRRRLHEAIAAQPGIHYQALVRAVGKANGTVEHHLGKLTAAGIVRSAPAGGLTAYFLPGKEEEARAGPALRSELARLLLELKRQQPGITIHEAAARLNAAPATVHYHLQRLRKAGLIPGDGSGAAATGRAAA